MTDTQQYTSHNGPEGDESAEIIYDNPGGGIGIQSVESQSDALIIKDCRPWGTDANEQVFDDLNVDYDVIPSSRLAETTLEDYMVVVLPSTQDSSYYDRLAEANDDIERFVAGGGTLVAHVTDDGWPCATQWNESFLPDDVGKENTLRNDLSIEAETHPLVESFSDETLDGWGSSTHGYLTNLPDDATVVATIGGDESRPTYADYGYESGRVLVTMQTMEWPYTGSVGSRPEDPRALLQTELEIALDGRRSQRVSAQSTILHYINGENENVTEGGHPLHSAQMQVFPRSDSVQVPLSEIPRLPDVSVPFPLEPVLDSWQKGDMIMQPDTDLKEATKLKDGKNADEYGDAAFKPYRFKNQVSISFTSPDGEAIDKESLRIRFNEEGTSDDTVEYKGEPESYTVLVGDDINNLRTDEWFDSLRERGTRVDRDYSIDTVEVGKTEGVRVSTVTSGYAGFAHEIVDRAARNPIHFLATIFGWYEVVEDLPGVDDLPDVGWDDLPDPPEVPDSDDLGDLPNTPDWDIPDGPDLSDSPSWDDVPDLPDSPSWDDVPDLPDRPGWDDVPDPDIPDLTLSVEGASALTADAAGQFEPVSDGGTATMSAQRTAPAEFGVDLDNLSADEIIDLIAPHLPDIVEEVVDLLTAVPNIYSFYELTVLADGRRFTRVWDTSRFPSNALYVDGQRQRLNVVPYKRKQLFSARMAAFFVVAKAGISPYKGIDSKENYLNWLRARRVMDDPGSVLEEFDELDDVVRNYPRIFAEFDFDVNDIIVDTPQWIVGYDATGDRIANPEAYLSSNIPSPF